MAFILFLLALLFNIRQKTEKLLYGLYDSDSIKLYFWQTNDNLPEFKNKIFTKKILYQVKFNLK